MRTRILVGVIVLMVVAAACGDGTTTTTTTTTPMEPAASTTTTVEVTTTTAVVATTTAPTITTPSRTTTTTTTTPAMTTVEAAVAFVEVWLADEFEASEPPEGVLGPSELVCTAAGPIAVGGVFGCSLVPNTSPDLQLDEGAIVVYVLDATGRSAWSAGTDVPGSQAGLADALALAGTDLLCKDLMDPEVMAYPFSGVGRPADSAYFWSLVYWSLTGQPDRMDADGDGIPCETLHDAAIVTQVLSGGPVY